MAPDRAWLALARQPVVKRSPDQAGVARRGAWSILAAYLLKGIAGPTFSSYLMPDGATRRADLSGRTCSGTTLGQFRAFFKAGARAAALEADQRIGQVQQVCRETLGDLLRESIAVVGFAGSSSTTTRAWRSSA